MLQPFSFSKMGRGNLLRKGCNDMEQSSIYKRVLVKHSVPSAYLHESRDITVYLPPGYREDASYPVLYGQDGLELFNFGRAATTANQLILEQKVEPFLIVGVHVNLPNRTADYSPDGERFGAYCRFFAEELVPFIEATYPVRADATNRVLVGDSLGATVSLHLALDYASLFGKVICLSGAFFQPTVERIRRESDLSRLAVYQLIGTLETEVKTDRGVFDFLAANRATRRELEQKHASLTYRESEGKHVWGFWQRELPDALLHMFG